MGDVSGHWSWHLSELVRAGDDWHAWCEHQWEEPDVSVPWWWQRWVRWQHHQQRRSGCDGGWGRAYKRRRSVRSSCLGGRFPVFFECTGDPREHQLLALLAAEGVRR